jgi:hypothetical protein
LPLGRTGYFAILWKCLLKLHSELATNEQKYAL